MASALFLSPTSLVPLHGLSSETIPKSNLFTPSYVLHKLPREVTCGISYSKTTIPFLKCDSSGMKFRKKFPGITRSSGSSPSNSSPDDSKASDKDKVPFGYSRKDVLLIGVGITLFGVGLKGGLEFFGVDPLQAGNVVQLVLVLGLTVGWISTYIFRVSNKEMTYAQQLRDYESKVMQKRLEGLNEAELEVLLEQVEEEKQSLASGKNVN